MLDSPMLVDQDMVYRSITDQRDHFPKIHLDVSLFSGIHQICIPTFPFDPPTQSDTRYICNMGKSDLPDMYAAPECECGHIRQITTAHVTYVM